MKRILINATQPEELRVAIVDGQKLHDLDIEVGSREQRKANVYKGRVTRVEPSLEAAFIDYGGNRHGFLPLKEVAKEYFNKDQNGGKDSIKHALSEGQEIIVQVEKEERGNKGAALTTFVSLAGRYLVLMPNNPRAGGVSRRIEGEDRNELREALNEVQVPNGMGVIVRTAGVGRCAEELQWDLDYLAHVWKAIGDAAAERKAPFLIYQESNVIIRALRDYLRDDIGEVVIDQDDIYETGREFMQQVMPHALGKLKHYTDETPLFSRFQVESQIESAFEREVTLPSGGSIVIDHTEAMTSVDINSARATKGGGIEETAFNTNLEAADEVARQLRIRDLGGLVVIDFIDMENNKNQREVENRLKQAAKADRARVQIGRISRFGLLEMSRQRLKPSLSEYSSQACPRCLGRGSIRSVESLALSILRLLEEEAMKPATGRVIVQLPVAVASFLLNEKRDDIAGVEKRSKTQVTLVPNSTLETPHYEIKRVRGDQLAEDANDATSYRLDTHVEIEKPVEPDHVSSSVATREEPAVKRVARPDAPVIERKEPAAEQRPAQAAVQAAPAMTPWQQLWDAMRRIVAGDRPATPAPSQSTNENTSESRGDRQAQNSGQNKTQSSDSDKPQKTRPSRGRRSNDNAGQSDNSSGGNKRSRRGGRNRRSNNRGNSEATGTDDNRSNQSKSDQSKSDQGKSNGNKPEAKKSDQKKAADNNNSSAKNNGSKNKNESNDKKAADGGQNASRAKQQDAGTADERNADSKRNAPGNATADANVQDSDSSAGNGAQKKPASNQVAADNDTDPGKTRAASASTGEDGDQAQAQNEGQADSQSNDQSNDQNSESTSGGRRRRRRGGRGRRGGRNRNRSNENDTGDNAESNSGNDENVTATSADDDKAAQAETAETAAPADSTPTPADDTSLNADKSDTRPGDSEEAPARQPSAEKQAQASSKLSTPAPEEEQPWSAVTASDNARAASQHQAATTSGDHRDATEVSETQASAAAGESPETTPARNHADKAESAAPKPDSQATESEPAQEAPKADRTESETAAVEDVDTQPRAEAPSAEKPEPAKTDSSTNEPEPASREPEADGEAQDATLQQVETQGEQRTTQADIQDSAEAESGDAIEEASDETVAEAKPRASVDEVVEAGEEDADADTASSDAPLQQVETRSGSGSSKTQTKDAGASTQG